MDSNAQLGITYVCVCVCVCMCVWIYSGGHYIQGRRHQDQLPQRPRSSRRPVIIVVFVFKFIVDFIINAEVQGEEEEEEQEEEEEKEEHHPLQGEERRDQAPGLADDDGIPGVATLATTSCDLSV